MEYKNNQNLIITVNRIQVANKALLTLYYNFKKIFETEAFIGKNGITANKKEGDGRTPKGMYELGIIFGTHDKEKLGLEKNIKYIKINKNLYWVDDANSKYYNQLVDISKVVKDWRTAEHLIEYLEEYEYAIEIKTNPQNIPGKGSAIFIHCSANRPTQGCIAIYKEKMIELLEIINKTEKMPKIMIK